MSREFQGLAFRAGRNDQPFLFMQRVAQQKQQEEALKAKDVEKRRQEDSKWANELMNTNFSAINITADNIIRKQSEEVLNDYTRLYQEKGGRLSEDDKYNLSLNKSQIKANHTFLQSTNEEFKKALQVVTSNKDYYNYEEAYSALRETYDNEIITKDGRVNTAFDPSQLYEKVNQYKNLKQNNIIKDALQGISDLEKETTSVRGGTETKIKRTLSKFVEMQEDGVTPKRDDNGVIVVNANEQLLSMLSSNDLMNRVIEGKAEELGVTKKEALDDLLKNHYTFKETVTTKKDPNIISGGRNDKVFEWTISSSEDIATASYETANQTGIVAVQAVNVDFPGVVKDLALEGLNLEGDTLSPGKYSVEGFGIDEQGRRYVKIYNARGEYFEKIPYNETNLTKVRNAITDKKKRTEYDKMVKEVNTEFGNAKKYSLDTDKVNVLKDSLRNMVEDSADPLQLTFEGLTKELNDIGLEAKVSRGFWGGRHVKVEGKEYNMNRESDIEQLSKLIFEKNPDRFIRDGQSTTDLPQDEAELARKYGLED